MSRTVMICGLVSLLAVGLTWQLVADDNPQKKPRLFQKETVQQKQPKSVDTDEPIKTLKEKITPESPLAKFMRKKLSASNLVLEGLVTENYGLISMGAKQMEAMSQEEQWRVSNDAIYRQLSDDFQRITQQLQKDAKGTSIDAAALTWNKATMSCIECHKYTQGILISGE